MRKRTVLITVMVLLMALPVIASAKEVPQTVPSSVRTRSSNDLLQFRSGGLVIGFAPQKIYMAGMGYLLTEEFVGTEGVRPVPEGGDTKGAVLSGSRGHKGAPELIEVTYPNLWPGITAHYESRDGAITESRYIIGSGADPGKIRLRYNGAPKIQKDGSIRFSHPTKRGYFTMSAPVAWQEIGGRRIPVFVAFYEYGDGTIGFKAKGYDRGYPLVIDPTYEWHTFYGSSSDDYGYGIAVDGSGNLYVTGYSYATWQGDGDTDPIHPHSGGHDIFILKLAPSGAYQWHTFYGSSSYDYDNGIAVDGHGNVYVTGRSSATWQGDGDTSPIHPYSGSAEIFVLKLNASGGYQWHTFYGSSSSDYGEGIAVDRSGNLYVTGYSYATWQGDGDTSPIHPHSGSYDIFILKLAPSGAYQWHTFYGSAADWDYGEGIAADGSGNLYVTGESHATWQGDGDTSPIHPYSGSYDIFVLKLNASGGYQWHTFYGSSSDDYGEAIAVDGSGNVYVTGESDATWQGDGNTDPLHAYSGNSDIFVLKLNSSGTYQWHTFYGSASDYDEGYGIAVDGSGNLYVTGESDATWQGDGGTDPLHAYSGYADIFILKLNASGTYQWHTFYGSSSDDYGEAIAVDGSGNLYVTGESYATWQGDNSTDPLHAYSGNSDIFILKLGQLKLTISRQGTGNGTVTSNPSGIDCGADCSETFNKGTTVTLTATPDPGSTFAGWSGDCSGTGNAIVTMDADKTCTATFTLNQYTITASASPSAGGSVSCSPNPVDHGSTSTCTITTNNGYTLQGVGGTCGGSLAGNTYTTSAITQDCTVQANFTLNQYTITESASPSAGGSVSCSPNPVDHGSTSTCTITTNNGYTLQGVTGTCGGTLNGNTYTTNPITQDCTVVANFTLNNPVTIPSATGRGDITLETGTPGCGFYAYSAKTETDVANDPDYDYPYGLVEFRVNCPSADVTVTFPGDVSGLPYRKYGPTTPGDSGTTQWYEFTDTTRSGNQVTLHLQDGVLGDDTAVDGIIVDQGGPGQPPEEVAVPTMTEWGMMIFIFLAGLGSVYYLRRRA